MHDTLNFIPLQTKKDLVSKENSVLFSPKSTKEPLKSVYKKVSKVQYSRTIYTSKEKNEL